MRCQRTWWSWLALALVVAGCRPSTSGISDLKIAVSNTYLESAVRDLLGDSVTTIRLAEPGMCPGHFDLRPSQVTDLRSCQMLLRFDFQQSLDAKLRGNDTNRPKIVSVAVTGGLGRPESYAVACRQVADALVANGWMSAEAAQTRLRQIAERLDQLSIWAKEQIAQAGLAERPVLASAHQRDFCAWLGLNVVADFRPADSTRLSELDQAIASGQSAGVKLVIANLPEGRRTADALAERLEARVVVFGNFPQEHNGSVSFDKLLKGNIEALLREWQL